MSIKELSAKELFYKISPDSEVHNELRRRGILRTKNLVGEIGEYYVFDFFKSNSNLTNPIKPPPNVQNIDFYGMNGKSYSIKTVSSRKGTTGSFWNPEDVKKNIKTFDFLIIVILNNSYELDLLLELTWNDFFKFKKFNKRMNNHNISITKNLIESVKILSGKL